MMNGPGSATHYFMGECVTKESMHPFTVALQGFVKAHQIRPTIECVKSIVEKWEKNEAPADNGAQCQRDKTTNATEQSRVGRWDAYKVECKKKKD